jgi:purine-nucleoside phosphorylase
MLRRAVAARDPLARFGTLEGFLEPILPFETGGRTYWFATAYGGAMLSEWLHLACLFGSGMNLLLGSCGGLHPDAAAHDLIVPTHSHGDESSTRAYAADGSHRHPASPAVRAALVRRLRRAGLTVWEGPTTTHQAMLAETWEDVQRWSQEGFYGVEMEAATTFAVSRHFGVPSAAILRIADNLIRQGTIYDPAYAQTREQREHAKAAMFDAALDELLGQAPSGG